MMMVVVNRSSLVWILPLLLLACGEDAAPIATPSASSSSSSSSSGTAASPPATTDQTLTHLSGTYEVPASAELAGVSTYATVDIHWTLLAGEARLAYDLPAAIVGRKLSVDFRGPFDAHAGTGTLTGTAGTAECALTGTTMTCRETMGGLLPIEVDREGVTASATADAVSVADRIAVADQFARDPIGILRFELPAP